MLPSCRLEGEAFSIPKFTVAKPDVEAFLDELRGFPAEFRHCFARSEPRENFFRYLVGQLSELERKSIEPMAMQVEGGNVRAMQRFITDVVWDEAQLLRTYHTLVQEDLGDPQGVLVFDETGFPKKGPESAGVGRQYCGAWGKVENCQVGVFMAYASPHGYALLDKRLFIPEAWFSEAYQTRRSKCDFPTEVAFKTKPQMAAEMLQAVHQEDILPFKYVAADEIYGNSEEFLEAVEQCTGVIYFVSVPSATRCWLQPPQVKERTVTCRGKTRPPRPVPKTEKQPMTVERLAKSLNNFYWYKRKVSEGVKGPITYEFTKRQVTLSKKGLPHRTVWLIMKRTISDNPSYSFYISNAPASARLPTFVWLAGMRWPIEQCFEETKSELGLDHYEVRKYAAWRHHVLTCMLAHFFLWHLKIKLGKKSATYYSIAA